MISTLTCPSNSNDHKDLHALQLGRGKEMVDRLSNLVGIFANPSLDFSGNRAEGDDLLGDAYEYLMRHFATESGKSKGPVLYSGGSFTRYAFDPEKTRPAVLTKVRADPGYPSSVRT